jgi:hypothetical protein
MRRFREFSTRQQPSTRRETRKTLQRTEEMSSRGHLESKIASSGREAKKRLNAQG